MGIAQLLAKQRRIPNSNMIPQEETSTLIKRFRSQPGIEGEDLDFKGKEKVTTTEQREGLIRDLSAFANNGGGSLILGVENDGTIQGFGPDEEVRRDLTHVAQSDTRPILSERYWEFSPVEFEGESVIRINVRGVNNRLIKFYSEERGWLPYTRDNDTTVPMTHDQIEVFYRRVKNRHEHDLRQQPDTLGRTEDLSVTSPDGSTLDLSQQYSDDRVVSKTKRFVTVVPYTGNIEAFDKRALYDLSDNINIFSINDVQNTLEKASSSFDTDLGENFNYTIKEQNYQWTGKTVEHFLHDVEHFASISQEIRNTIESAEDSFTPRTRDRPHMFACSKSDFGVFWLELLPLSQGNVREEVDYFHAFSGLLLDDIPFNDRPLFEFFDSVCGEPTKYRQRTGTQKLRFWGNDTILEGVEPFDYVNTGGLRTYGSFDNPLYNHGSTIDDEFQDPLPNGFVQGLSAVDKLLGYVSGGIGEDYKNKDHVLTILDCIRMGKRQCPTYLLYANLSHQSR